MKTIQNLQLPDASGRKKLTKIRVDTANYDFLTGKGLEVSYWNTVTASFEPLKLLSIQYSPCDNGLVLALTDGILIFVKSDGSMSVC